MDKNKRKGTTKEFSKRRKKMKLERIWISCSPAIFFFLGIIFLAISPLNMSKIVTLQYDSFNVFMETLKTSDILSAIFVGLDYVWSNVIWIILAFLTIISVGLLIYMFSIKKTDFRLVLVSMIVFLILSFVITNFSIPILAIALSLFLNILWMTKTFEHRKNYFSTGFFLISQRLSLLNVFLAIGIFLTILMNMQVYEEKITQANERMLASFIPNSTDVKEAQKMQIGELTEGFKSSLTVRYQSHSSDFRNQCKPLYDGMISVLDEYKERSFKKIDESEIPVVGGEVEQYFPFFGILEKLAPLFIAFSAYFLVYVLIPVMGIFGGIVYTIVRAIKQKKTI
jgi:hypothetical protein